MKNILVLYNGQSMYTPTVQDYVEAFSRYSKHNVHYLQVGEGTYPAFDVDDYDLLLITYSVRLCYFERVLSAPMRRAISNFRGLKAAFVQDEYQETNTLRRALLELEIDLVFTCVPDDRIDWVYPPEQFSGTRFVRVLTGYVPERLRHVARDQLPALVSRPNWIGYRGRSLGYCWGDLSHYKVEIGRRFKRACERHEVPHDIAWTEQARIYQDEWYAFITSCRTTLGTPSGVNVFDWDGSLEREFAELIRRRPRLMYREYRPRIADREAKIDMSQVSPRMFEAAALGTVLVLLDADYGGILEPDVHYIPVRRDFSNVDEVIEQVRDTARLEEIATAAHEHLVASESWSYEAFITQVDAELDGLGGADVSAVRRSGFLPVKAYDQAFLEEHTADSVTQYPLSRWLDLSRLRTVQPGEKQLQAEVLDAAPAGQVLRVALRHLGRGTLALPRMAVHLVLRTAYESVIALEARLPDAVRRRSATLTELHDRWSQVLEESAATNGRAGGFQYARDPEERVEAIE